MQMETTQPTCSVVICTYKRTDVLDAALQSVMEQTLPPKCYEVLVIDNDSAASAEALVRQRQEKAKVSLTYAVEIKPGLSSARNRGVALSRGSIIVFIDDDAEASPGWLASLLDAFKEETVWAAGGKVLPIWDAPRPAWLPDKLVSA